MLQLPKLLVTVGFRGLSIRDISLDMGHSKLRTPYCGESLRHKLFPPIRQSDSLLVEQGHTSETDKRIVISFDPAEEEEAIFNSIHRFIHRGGTLCDRHRQSQKNQLLGV